jgi:hypothetical protein
MQVRALRRLSRTELQGIGIGLDAIGRCETELVAALGTLRDAAIKEHVLRVDHGVPVPGPYEQAFLIVRRTIPTLTLARMECEVTAELGKVPNVQRR